MDRSSNRRFVAVMLVAVALGVIAAPGCVSSARRPSSAGYSQGNLLFAPPESGLVTRDVPRSDWPSTTVFDNSSEQITYNEYLTDIQGLSNTGRDYTYRRFSSTRKGIRRR